MELESYVLLYLLVGVIISAFTQISFIDADNQETEVNYMLEFVSQLLVVIFYPIILIVWLLSLLSVYIG